MSEHITDQAIEAAATATQEVCETYDPGGWTEEENWAIWARQIIEAAAPHIMAQALKEAADNVPDYDLPFMVNGRNVEHVSWWLAGRAAKLTNK